MEKEMRRTGKFDKDGREMMAGDIVHFRCKNFSLSGRGIVFLAEKRGFFGRGFVPNSRHQTREKQWKNLSILSGCEIPH